MEITDFSNKAKQLVDDIKGVCNNAGLGGDADEYKIVTQSFLYKFINDKFLFEIAKLNPSLASYDDLKALGEDKYALLMTELGTRAAHLQPEHLLEYLFKHQNDDNFAKLFDETLNAIAIENSEVFSVHTSGNTEIRLFEEELIQRAVNDRSKHDQTARLLINKITNSKFNFDAIFSAGFDFFSTLFEYMIKDFNKDGSGTYAEYYTPHSVAKIMAEILVGDSAPTNATAYDPAAGSGTLLMNIAHKIGPDKCTIYSQDLNQKSSNLLRMNLILNGLSHSIDHIVQGNTITEPRHIAKKFDFIVSNPPFKLDFSDDHNSLSGLPNVNDRFFAGIPNVPKKNKDGMAIYLLFLQHIIFSLSETGKAAIVVPTGFITAKSGIENKILKKIVDDKMLRGVVSMPSNIFATTNTNVSVLFVDKENTSGKIVLVDASKLGKQIKEGKNKKTILSRDDEQRIVSAFVSQRAMDDFSAIVDYDAIRQNNYSLSAGQYFDIKIEYTVIPPDQFEEKLEKNSKHIEDLFIKNTELQNKIQQALEKIKHG